MTAGQRQACLQEYRLIDAPGNRRNFAMDWLNALILFLLILGHTTLWITFVNRTHGFPIAAETLRRFRHLHDIMIPLFPVLVVWQVGLTGPRLLVGGSWQELSLLWVMIFAICTAGTFWLGYVTLRTLLSRPPALQSSGERHIHDLAKELGESLIEPGPYRLLARMPFNEQWQLDRHDKILRLPNLPAEWDGLTVLHLSDWHLTGTVSQKYFRRVSELATEMPADLICFTGDLIDNSDLLWWLPETLGILQGRLGNFFILGNHDWYQETTAVREALENLGWRHLGSQSISIEIAGRRLALAGDETPWMGRHPKIDGKADFRLVLSHTPDNISWARGENIELLLCGHNHGGQVRLPLIGPVYSPSRYGCKYASGTFWESPTLMHVSRGLSGQHPLRWRCRPEINRLILRRADRTR